MLKKDARQTNTTHNGKTGSSDNAYRGFGLSIPNTEQTAPTPSHSIFSKKMTTLDLGFSTQYPKKCLENPPGRVVQFVNCETF